MTDLLKICASAPIRLYRAVVSPLFGPVCRFEPTCSTYALEAVRRHGALKGGVLALWRIVRCNPWHSCSRHDPVPETLSWSIDWRKPIGYKRGKTSRGCAHNN